MDLQEKIISWDFPLTRVHCSVTLGNGDFGAMVWGKENLHITVNRSDYWHHMGGGVLLEGVSYEKIKEAYDPLDDRAVQETFPRDPEVLEGTCSPRLPCGRFDLVFNEGIKPLRAVLNCATGLLSVVVSNENSGAELELGICLSPVRDLLLISDPNGVVSDVLARPAWEWASGELENRGFSGPKMLESGDRKGWIQDCPNDDPSALALCERSGSEFLIGVCLGENQESAEGVFEDLIEYYQNKGRAAIYDETESWWGNYWSKVPEINIPSEFFTSFINYSLFKFAAATNPKASLPCALQGPWVEEHRLPSWGAAYTFNVNIEQIYTLGFPIGAFDHFEPLFKLLESEHYQKIAQENARIMLGIDDGFLTAHNITDKGYYYYAHLDSPYPSLDHAVAGWMAQLYWLYYQHTLDDDFLRDRAYPFMVKVMRVFETVLEEKDGKLSMAVARSAEYNRILPDGRFQGCGKDPSFQLSCVHMLTDALLEASEILGVEPKAKWFEIKEKTPHFSLAGKPGEERISIWDGQDLDVCHRHHSHLASIYPFDSLGETTPEVDEIIDNSIDHWISMGMGMWSEWCVPWAAIIQSRMGFKEAPLQLMKWWKEVFINEAGTVVYTPLFRGLTAHRKEWTSMPKETHEVMQLDGAMAGVTAFIEMMVHTKNKTHYVFPAISPKWSDVSFSKVHLPGAFQIGADRKDGVTARVEISSKKGGKFKLAVPDRETMLLEQAGTKTEISLPATLEFSPEESVVLT